MRCVTSHLRQLTENQPAAQARVSTIVVTKRPRHAQQAGGGCVSLWFEVYSGENDSG